MPIPYFPEGTWVECSGGISSEAQAALALRYGLIQIKNFLPTRVCILGKHNSEGDREQIARILGVNPQEITLTLVCLGGAR